MSRDLEILLPVLILTAAILTGSSAPRSAGEAAFLRMSPVMRDAVADALQAMASPPAEVPAEWAGNWPLLQVPLP